MKVILYSFAIFTFIHSNYGHYKSKGKPGEQPLPGTSARMLYDLGGLLSQLFAIILLVIGFIIFKWWIPVTALVASLAASTHIYNYAPLGAEYVVYGFPVGIFLGILVILQAV